MYSRIDTHTVPSTLLAFGFMVQVMAIDIPYSSRRYTAICRIRYGVQPYYQYANHACADPTTRVAQLTHSCSVTTNANDPCTAVASTTLCYEIFPTLLMQQ
jgi:hypothetical protein